MTQRTPGRHRRPGRLRTTSTTLTRTAAVAATSTGLLAGAALSANAAPEVPQDRDGLLRLGPGVSAGRTVTVDRPAEAVAAPSDIELDSFGIGGFSAYTPPGRGGGRGAGAGRPRAAGAGHRAGPRP
ncbi:hypothetical protein BJF86_04700 [Serinicoccus sp. CNJ-927]|uniref:hypothetical protein n=1 Tax=Serinicoccus sp. CNJ-927 TaxID=1904970 RepID=UPI0009604221|nr:hypothetical protein [Serinicoccus sp. CNJ-927]OLT40122.1 hypothetical protein BJF86_04700 [Serinicoccus sp. CNJ-927]